MSIFTILKDSYTTKTKLSTEMIAIQKDDYVITKLIETFDNIRNLIISNEIKTNKGLFTNPDTRLHIDKLDSILKERFGITFKHIGSDLQPYAVLTVPPVSSNNVLFGDVKKIYAELKTHIDTKNIKKTDNVITYHDNKTEDQIGLNWKTSFDSLEKILNTKGVKIDLKNAKIIGLPDDYIVTIFSNLYNLLINLKLDSKVIVAILLHEVGHAFTHLENSYKTIKNTSVLVDTLQENIKTKNKTPKESIVLAYEKVFDDKLSEDDKKDVITATVAVFDKYAESIKYMTNTHHSYIDSEQLADQFAGRFGLQHELVIGLKVIYAEIDKLQLIANIGFISFTFFIVFAMSIISMTLMAALTHSLVSVLFGIIVGFLFKILNTFLYSSTIDLGTNGSPIKYDEYKRRIERIRNEAIRTIRMSYGDISILKSMISTVENIDILLLSLPEQKIDLVKSLVLVFSNTGRTAVNNKRLEQLYEDLMENDLHLAAAKIKTQI